MTDDAKQEREGKLLPCPFCGNPPKSGDGTYGYWLIFCSDENNCPAQPSVGHKTEAEAIAAWNTRQPQPDALKIAREALERIEVATRNEVRAGNKGYVSRYGINGIARAALEQSK